MIYLDNAATTFPKPESVYVAMDKANRELGINAGRGSYKLAREASELIADTKRRLRDIVHADIDSAVVFSPSITVALNQVIHGISFNKNSIVYVSPYEHNAVARTIHNVSEKIGFKVKLLPIDSGYEIDLDKTRYEFSKEKPSVVICTHVSNVTGYILPIEEIFREAKKYEAICVLDSAQSLGLVPIDVRNNNVDILAFAGHKTLYGPFGIGGFINVSGIELEEYITGGTGSDSLNLDMPNHPEGKYEAASNNIVAIAGLNAALEALDVKKNFEHERKITEYLIRRLQTIKNVHMYLPNDLEQHVGIISLTFDGLKSEDVGMILDEDFDIAVRTGFHCAPYIHEYLRDKSSLGTVRIGLGQFNTQYDIDSIIDALKQIAEE
ncbi:aminotransferase class V-fold PLP-dependent enzyme [Butyrivibrio sp. YAB3001]|uniref:aminotransferase class V-fold PLP-dependent enzyme n=1 Tax=Butyrivibrio sp. YAB3001 TaxID=1520812 RepID=UPI0008F66360|nr:aminotransferase class V-fold PLP-dependent enzyme [Butyrivibrio sp. YAB3001]SFC69845.1 cysteine desulfurase family protein [Butyrivibrio sp. YAB3001]